MLEFADETGASWTAAVAEQPGPNYKGRFILQIASADGDQVFTLPEVAWNSTQAAQRTLDTMSEVELRRRLRACLRRENPVSVP